MIQMWTGSRVILATGLTASVLAVTVAGSSASPAAATPKADASSSYGGFSGEGWSTPLRVELFEPSLPVPASPQVEFELGYSKVKADSGTAQGRASYLWPGDTVGEGLRAFAGLLGLPVDNPITGGGYPVQVNSQYPGEPATQADEPVPGMVMRTTSGDKRSVAETGFSPDGEDADAGADGGGGGSSLLGGLQATLGSLLPGLGGGKATPSTPSMPGLPAPLTALVDVDGLVARSQIGAVDGPVTSTSRAALGEVRLLGGLLTLGGSETVARATTDGTKGVATGKAQWGRMTIAGQEFSIGPDGAVVAGQKKAVPILGLLPAAALKALGISFEIPKPVRTVDGDLATSVSEGLRIIIETKTLSPLLSAIPSGKLAELIPASAGPVKGIVSGLSTLAPKVVITLGVASATVDTVPPVDIAPPDTAPVVVPPASAPGISPTGGLPPAIGGPAAMPPAANPGATNPLPVSMKSGLLGLYSFPGLLVFGAVAAVAAVGTWMRRLGALSMAAGPCSHGFDTGLPDLRRA